MNIKFLYPSFIVLLVVLLASCERPATVEIPYTGNQLVLYSFLSPDESGVKVTLTLSQPIYGNGGNGYFPPIKDASVKISDNNGHTQTLSYSEIEEAYFVDQSVFPINPGYTYTIEASQGTRKILGKTTVPNSVVPFTDLKVDKYSTGNQGEEHYIFGFKWKDEANSANYYRINLEEYFASGKDTNAYSLGDGMFSDKNKDGQDFSSKFDYYNYKGDIGTLDPSFYVYLINSDIHYYEYHRRRLVYFGDDPFSEPAPQYSNVEGGLGVVCSFRKHSERLN
ncbi:MAG: hypothetical protein CFE21_14565 [Bacteroidetes bacterium B1(2017)]|nr:MAG: hypothetical protein CFE21_14565 [Bacteroidetes bacterium B1(2017)]